MRKRITAITIAGIAILAMSLGCTDKETQALYKNAVQQMAVQSDSINSLKIAVQRKTDSLEMAMQMTGSSDQRVDSLTQKLQRTSSRAANLSKELETLKEDCVRLEESLRSEIQQRDSVLVAIDAIFSDTNYTLATVRQDLGNEKTRTQFLTNLVEKIRPWYAKWKHDATKRGFLKVLFASGKAKKPDFPEPNLDSIALPAPDTSYRIMPPAPRDTSKADGVSMRDPAMDRY